MSEYLYEFFSAMADGHLNLGLVDGIITQQALCGGDVRPEIAKQSVIFIPTTRRPLLVKCLLKSMHDIECQKIILVSDIADEISYKKELHHTADITIISAAELRYQCLRDLNSVVPSLSLVDLANVIEQNGTWDLPQKRNLALLNATYHGFRRLILLDDDISIEEGALRKAIAASGNLALLGFLIDQFPDLSVVDHASRNIYGEYQPFIAGNCLIIDLDRTLGFFPPLYNEDWLFVFSHVRSQVGFVSNYFAHQRKYDPFKPELAAWQEIGDAIASGMYELWASDRINDSLTLMFWRSSLDTRRQYLKKLMADLLHRREGNSLQVLKCLEAAYLKVCELKPEQLLKLVSDAHANARSYAQLLNLIRYQFSNGS